MEDVDVQAAFVPEDFAGMMRDVKLCAVDDGGAPLLGAEPLLDHRHDPTGLSVRVKIDHLGDQAALRRDRVGIGRVLERSRPSTPNADQVARVQYDLSLYA